MSFGAQLRLCLLLLATLCVVIAGVAVLARTTPVFSQHVARELELLRQTNGLYYFDNAYVDEGDYVLLGQIEQDDFSRGGVYFIGSSELNMGLMDWALTPGERRLIHNYSIGDLKHTEMRHYLRMLTEDTDLLQAGGDKTTIILGLSFQLARRRQGEMYVENLFERHRLYAYDWQGGIHRRDLPDYERAWIIERDRASRFLHKVFMPSSRIRTEADTPVEMREHMHRVMAGDWREAMQSEVAELAATIDDLQARGVRVWALYPPSGSWQDEMPYEAAYRDMVGPILEARGVPLTDYGDLLPDAQYMDALHARHDGQLSIHRAYHALALRALADMGTEVAP